MNTADRYAAYLLTNYGVPALTLVQGRGARVTDDAGKTYLDFCTGIAVNALGHAHPVWVKAVQEQAAKLAHVSNLFRNEPQALLAEKVVEKAGPGRVLFCNSGAEANEALIKLARLHGKRRNNGVEGVITRVVVAQNAFHGRTYGAMSATPQEKIQGGFRPMLDGFVTGNLNDLESFEVMVDDRTAAVLVEPIQGEGGLTVAQEKFLNGLRALCDRRGALLMFDEIQAGIGRTGQWFGHQHAGVKADAFSMAKGLGGGFPIGGIWVAKGHDDLFTPGSHGTTFGGNPLACAAALAVIEVIESENLLNRIAVQTPVWHAALRATAAARPDVIKDVRGLGYMTGLALTDAPGPFVAALREAGLLVAPAGDNVVRLLPPLTATTAELAESASIVDKVVRAMPVKA
jgi:acetylornithine/N-succinyldiaminopimelate aminotransferase